MDSARSAFDNREPPRVRGLSILGKALPQNRVPPDAQRLSVEQLCHGGIRKHLLGADSSELAFVVDTPNTMWGDITPGREETAWADLYASVPPSSFSDQVLTANARALSVLRASDLGWTDLGEAQRVFDLLGAKPGANAAQRWLAGTRELPAY